MPALLKLPYEWYKVPTFSVVQCNSLTQSGRGAHLRICFLPNCVRNGVLRVSMEMGSWKVCWLTATFSHTWGLCSICLHDSTLPSSWLCWSARVSRWTYNHCSHPLLSIHNLSSIIKIDGCGLSSTNVFTSASSLPSQPFCHSWTKIQTIRAVFDWLKIWNRSVPSLSTQKVARRCLWHYCT
jgi:hypothetical protein